jgi:hypothetical protein
LGSFIRLPLSIFFSKAFPAAKKRISAQVGLHLSTMVTEKVLLKNIKLPVVHLENILTQSRKLLTFNALRF